MAYAVDAQGKKTSGGGSGGGGGSSFADTLSGILNAIVGTVGLAEPVRQQWSDTVDSAVQGWYDDVSSGGGGEAVAPVVQQAPVEQPHMIPSYSSINQMSPSYMSGPTQQGVDPGAMNLGNIQIPDIGKAVESAANAIGVDPRHEASLDVWERQSAKSDSDDRHIVRGTPLNPVDGYDDDEDDRSDNQLDMIGDNPVNDTYVRDAIRRGMSERQAESLYGGNEKPWWQFLADWVEDNDRRWNNPMEIADQRIEAQSSGSDAESPRLVNEDWHRETPSDVIDDGTLDYNHMTSDNMTGTQYMRYSRMGMGGIPYEEIVPNEVYSKTREHINNGFTPFVPDDATYARMNKDSLLDAPARLGAWVSDIRQNITPDYTINLGDRSFSGRGFDKKSKGYVKQTERLESVRPKTFLSEPADGREYTAFVNEMEIPDTSGRDTYHYGRISGILENRDGTFSLNFTDGSSVDVSPDYFNEHIDSQGRFSIPEGKVARVPMDKAKGKVPDSLSNDIERINTKSPLVYQTEIPDVSGAPTYHYGSLSEVNGNTDGTFRLGFTDGSDVTVSPEYFETIVRRGAAEDGSEDTFVLPDPVRVPVEQAGGSLPDDLSSIGAEMPIGSDESPLSYADVLYFPDMVLDDGTRINHEDAVRLFYDRTPYDEFDNGRGDNITYDFSKDVDLSNLPLFGTTLSDVPVIGGIATNPVVSKALNLAKAVNFLTQFDNKPKRLVQQEIFGENDGSPLPKVDTTDIPDNMFDWTAGSLPISIGRVTPWIYSLSNATSSRAGMDPHKYDLSRDSTGLSAGYYDKYGNLRFGERDNDGNRDDDRSDYIRYWNTIGNAAVPLTEMIAGPVAGGVSPLMRIPGLRKLSGDIPKNPTTMQVLGNALLGAFGEGLEEDVGNVFDEITDYGPAGLFTDQVSDNGRPSYDITGRELRDYSTPVWGGPADPMSGRLGNVLNPEDALNAFVGGALVDFMLQGGPTLKQIPKAVRRDAARRSTGVNQFVDVDNDEWNRHAADSFLDNYSDEIEYTRDGD